MSRRLAATLGLVVGVAILLRAGPAAVEAEDLPLQPTPTAPPWYGPAPYPATGRLWEEGSNLRGPVLRVEKAQAAAVSMSLGEPGLSFRYVQTFGVSEQPYIADVIHINRPHALFMDSSDNLFVAEEQGYRVLNYNSAGNNLLALGQAGMCYTDDYVFCAPQDIALDSGGRIWVADGNRVAQYSPTGTFLQQFPASEPWESGSDDGRFDQVRGVDFDSSGRMFVSDAKNHRVQVFNLGSGVPVYEATIGTAGVPGSGSNQFNSPGRLAVDSNDRLFVVDVGNDRVQMCEFNGSWTCSILDGGLSYPQGIAVDGSDNLYIADTYNGRIRKCSSSGICSDLITWTYGLYDLALDSSGNLYGAAAYEDIVVKYDGAGSLIGIVLGVEFVPYLTDNYHYNRPRVAVDPWDNLIVAEENGQRLLKLDSNGTPLWAVGVPGVDAGDNAHFNYPHGVATDQSGNIYVADGTRVQIFSSSGSYVATLGTGYGTGDYQFAWATGIAVDANGKIYVSDASNHRVQIYSSSRVYLATLGVSGVPGSDNSHLSWPIGIEVDSQGSIYVADIGNCRVQKFNSSLVYQMTFGITGSCGDNLGEVSAEDVTVDAQGRVYVSGWNNRVQLFDETGAYLATIGGTWGSKTSEFRGASGVAVDGQGNVYVADFANGRIQKFAPGYPGWVQVNINGFGDRTQSVPALAVFDDRLYAGTWGGPSEVWRSSNGRDWNEFTPAWTPENNVVFDIHPFGSHVYVGTGNDVTGGELWRTDGSAWEQVVSGGFGDSSNLGVNALAVFDGAIYAATNNDVSGAEVWRSDTGDAADWAQVNSDGFGGPGTIQDVTMETFGGHLYVGLGRNGLAELWRSSDGVSWTPVFQNGLGSASNTHVSAMEEFQGSLYIGLRNTDAGGQLWRSTEGLSWTQVFNDGLGNPDNQRPYGLIVHGPYLYLVFTNLETGAEVWRSSDGESWHQVVEGGWGDGQNRWTDYFDKGAEVFKGALYIGTTNEANGAQIWMLLHQIYLPLVTAE